jgi:hypothetical protein
MSESDMVLAAIFTPIVAAITLALWIAGIYYADFHPTHKHGGEKLRREVMGGAFEANAGLRQMMPIPHAEPAQEPGVPAPREEAAPYVAQPPGARVPRQGGEPVSAPRQGEQGPGAAGPGEEGAGVPRQGEEHRLVPGSRIRLRRARAPGCAGAQAGASAAGERASRRLGLRAQPAELGQLVRVHAEIWSGNRQRRHARAGAVVDRRGDRHQPVLQFRDRGRVAVPADLLEL